MKSEEYKIRYFVITLCFVPLYGTSFCYFMFFTVVVFFFKLESESERRTFHFKNVNVEIVARAVNLSETFYDYRSELKQFLYKKKYHSATEECKIF